MYLPKKINVGYRKRSDTYSGKLAYVIYFDDKEKLRKEISWNGWRDKDIPNNIFENIPTEGFVLNKKAGGYSTGWNHRNTYCRVYDSVRDFEFEISIGNLLFILENTNSLVGKGLEGEFVYGWDGKDLVLVPCSSPDYITFSERQKKVDNKTLFKGKDLILGATYLTKEEQEVVYIGRYYLYNKTKKEVKKYFFKKGEQFIHISSLSKDIISIVSDSIVDDYSNIVESFENSSQCSLRDPKKDIYGEYTKEEFIQSFKERSRKNYDNSTYLQFPSGECFVDYDGIKTEVHIRKENANDRSWRQNSTLIDMYYAYDVNSPCRSYSAWEYQNEHNYFEKASSLDELHAKIKPYYLTTFDSMNQKIKEFKNND